MPRTPQLLDRWGRPVRKADLTREVSAATIGGVRSPITGYPADGLTPVDLAAILREADAGDPVRYLELAETIEERDPHYIGVLGTRRRSVSQIDVTIEAAGDAPRDVQIADRIRDWLKRDELTEEIFDILDCIGKGFSFTEIVWDTSSGQWQPERLEQRDPRWFRFDRTDLATPLMLDEGGREEPLRPFTFIYATIKAKSGIALRSGLARVASWAWMFKAYTQRDWAIFTQTYGQPLRLGKFGADASEEDKNTLFRAVANIAGDCAAIIPESMQIDFVEAASTASTNDLYKSRADWLDQQISKAVLGQTATTDAVTGGLGSGKEHRQVQEDIERADARALGAILNRDLIRPWVDLEWGPQAVYPRLVIARPEREDLAAFSSAVTPLISAGLKIRAAEVREKFGLSDPEDGDEILGGTPPAPPAAPASGDAASLNGQRAVFKRGEAQSGLSTAAGSDGASAGLSEAPGILAGHLEIEARPAMADMLDQVEAMLAAAGSLEEFHEMLTAGFEDVDDSALAEVLGRAMVAAHAGGRIAVAEEEGGT